MPNPQTLQRFIARVEENTHAEAIEIALSVLLESGYHVIIIDSRGHGRSRRDTQLVQLVRMF